MNTSDNQHPEPGVDKESDSAGKDRRHKDPVQGKLDRDTSDRKPKAIPGVIPGPIPGVVPEVIQDDILDDPEKNP